MDRIIIIDDNGIQDDLDRFLESNKNHIRLNSDMTELSSGGNFMIKEIVESYESKYKIKFKSKDQVYIFRVNDILFFEAIKSGTRIYLDQKESTVINCSLAEVKNQLINYPFITVHSDYIINIFHISSISDDKSYVELTDKSRLPVSDYKKKIIISELEKYIK